MNRALRVYRIDDIVQEEYIQFPLSLLANPQYRDMSLEAKMMYALLRNRLTLSQRNHWINDRGEVYLIYTREEAADTLHISYKKAINAFKELIGADLLWEERQGRGYPNLLYVLKAEVTDADAAAFSGRFEDIGPAAESGGEPCPEQACQAGCPRPDEAAHPDMPKPHIKTCQNGMSGYAETAHQDLSKRQASKIENRKTENRKLEIHPSIDQQAELEEILENCELPIFEEGVREMFRTAVERLYYADGLRVGPSTLPQASVRRMLRTLTGDDLLEVLAAMQQNDRPVKNVMSYVMSIIINQISSRHSSLILHLPAGWQTGSDVYAHAPE